MAARVHQGDRVQGFDPATSFGPDVARRYDRELRGDETETVDFLEHLARGGPALEFAIGTGRIALPLSERGIRVDGIELSPDMVARLREKPGGDALDVIQGDMSRVGGRASYQLVYLVFNTIYNLLTQDDQVRCFENAARHLTGGGMFVVEAGVPHAWLRGTQFVNVERVTGDEVILDVNRYDPVTQILDENHVTLHERRDPARPDRVPDRPSERARSDGEDRRADAGRSLVGMAAGAVHRDQRAPHQRLCPAVSGIHHFRLTTTGQATLLRPPTRIQMNSTMIAPMMEPMMPAGWKKPSWLSLWNSR